MGVLFGRGTRRASSPPSYALEERRGRIRSMFEGERRTGGGSASSVIASCEVVWPASLLSLASHPRTRLPDPDRRCECHVAGSEDPMSEPGAPLDPPHRDAGDHDAAASASRRTATRGRERGRRERGRGVVVGGRAHPGRHRGRTERAWGAAGRAVDHSAINCTLDAVPALAIG